MIDYRLSSPFSPLSLPLLSAIAQLSADAIILPPI
jgi:hypothetical protein